MYRLYFWLATVLYSISQGIDRVIIKLHMAGQRSKYRIARRAHKTPKLSEEGQNLSKDISSCFTVGATNHEVKIGCEAQTGVFNRMDCGGNDVVE